MNFDDLLGKQRKSEPRVVLLLRIFALLIISSCLISYITILIIDVNDEIPAIKTSEVPVDSIAIPDFAFSFGFSFKIVCSFSWVNNDDSCMRYIITPKYIQGLYRGSFSLNDQSYLFTSPKQDEWLDTLAFVFVADDPSFNASMISVSPPYMPPYIQIFDPDNNPIKQFDGTLDLSKLNSTSRTTNNEREILYKNCIIPNWKKNFGVFLDYKVSTYIKTKLDQEYSVNESESYQAETKMGETSSSVSLKQIDIQPV
ncbi:2010_t:CDS:2 [Funneliformis mosseae]|uniref:2010_t:CDS:1 n=1 Tax=Funneliformis mosseae TaxID=27381 RepID=A0A9N8YTL5_FUNMO|nr:2010_t:CDS:2 [Funneliformis mosseae]